MDNVKLCATCQHQNTMDATACARCGAPLVALLPARITVPVPESLRNTIPTAPPPEPPVTKRFDDAFAVYVVGQKQPTIIPAEIKKIMFGRLSPGESAPTVDLTPFDAHLFGVSRQHAMVFRTDNGIFLQDLESTNGTWLNDIKLIPHKLYEVKSGDLVRLGQLGMRAYFETATTEYTIVLSDELTPAQRLTPAYLESRVSPYLIAIANVQQLIDTMLDRPPALVSIQSIEMDEHGRLNISLAGARDVLRMLETRFSQWREARMAVVDKLRHLNTQVKSQADQKIQRDLKTQSEPLRTEVRTQLSGYAREWMDAVAPDSAEWLRVTYAEKLIAPLQSLLFSPLQPIRATEKEPTGQSTTPAP